MNFRFALVICFAFAIIESGTNIFMLGKAKMSLLFYKLVI